MRALLSLLLFLSWTTARADSHVRWATASGPIHAWFPAGYDEATADLVVYIHGYSTDVDRAWREHRLAQQFEASGLDAMFVAAAAPRGHSQRVRWRSLGTLRDALRTRFGSLPGGRTIVVGHSGAHRTIAQWLAADDARIDALVLVDAHYGQQPQIRAWIERDPERRLIDIAAVTQPWADALHDALPETLVLEKLPEDPVAARVVYVRTSIGHMKLVTDGVAVPCLLRMLSARGTAL